MKTIPFLGINTKNMKKINYKIPKGSNFSTPRTPKILVREVAGQCRFILGDYTLNPSDQKDWNKLTGISFNMLMPNRNAAMVGWRWNPVTDKIELSAYFNVNGQNLYAENMGYPIVSVGLGEWFGFIVDYNRVTIQKLNSAPVTVYCPKDLKATWLTSFRIQPYFGGNNPASENIELEIAF